MRFKLLILCLLFLFICDGNAQVPATVSRVMKTMQSSPTTISFELWLKNASAEPLQYYAGQYFFDFNKAILAGDAELKIAASGLPPTFQPRNPRIDTLGSVLMFAVNGFPGTRAGFTINSKDSVLVLKAELTCKTGFYAVPLNLSMRVNKETTWSSMMFAYIGDRAKNISSGTLIQNDNSNFVLTGIKADTKKLIPETFAVEQNYPNPFNPTTVIQYQLPVASIVTLKIYDILGKEVITLENAEKTAGYYSVRFNGVNLSSGVYIYRVTAQGVGKNAKFHAVKKMMLVK